jgi:glycogen(starch) synthase
MSGRLIFHVSAEFGEQAWGGIATAVELMTEASAQCGDRVIVLTSSNMSQEVSFPNGVKWISIGSLPNDDFLLYHSADRVRLGAEFSSLAAEKIIGISGSHPALVCIHNEEFASLSERLRDVPGISVVLFSHGLAVQEHPENEDLIDLQNRYLESGFLVAVHSNAQRLLIDRSIGCVNTNFLPLPLCLLCSEEPTRKLGAVDEHLVVAAGRAVAQKGFDLLEAAFSSGFLPSAIRCEIYCQRSHENERTSKTSDKVTFMKWRRRKELLQAFNKARCLIVPSRFEPLGLVAAEALSCGLPVVYSEVGGLAELVGSGDCLGVGFQMIDDNEAIRNLSSAILAELEKPVRITGGRSYLADNFSVRRFDDGIDDLIRHSVSLK